MAFCRFCGNQIEDGAVCSCQQNAAPEQNTAPVQNTAAGQNASQVAGQAAAMAAKAGTAAKSALNGFVPYIKSYVKAPKATVHDAVVNGKFSIACGFFALNALTVIIAIWSLLGSLASLVVGVSRGAIDIDLPVFRMIFGGILISAAVIVLAAVTLLIISKLGQSGLNFTGALIAAAFHSFWPTVLVLGGTLIGLIGGFGLFIAVTAISFAIQMVTVTAISDARNLGACDVTSTSGKMFLVTLLLAIASGIISMVVMMLFSWCFGGVEVNDHALGNISDLIDILS